MAASQIVGIIPARWASTRFPGKPLQLIAGKPLLQHVWEQCRRAKTLDEIIVATDDMRIAEAAFGWGAQVALTRADHVSGTDRLAEVAKNLPRSAHLINIQGDEPLIDPRLINRLARTMRHEPDLQVVTAAHPFPDSAEATSQDQVKVVLDRNSNALYFSRAPIPFMRDSAAPVTYFRHQGIYGYTRAFLLRFVRWKSSPLERAESLEQLRALENGVTIRVIVTERGSPGVDRPADVPSIERELASR